MEQRIFRLARAGGIDTNPTTFNQRANTFASAVADAGHATLLTRREVTGLHGYLIASPAMVNARAPIHLAQTVGARAEEAAMPDDLGDTPVIGTLTYRHSPALRETQSGIDPTELPRILANAMPEGTWVAVAMRKPSNRERGHYMRWFTHRLGTAVPTHHSVTPNAMIISITAGGSTDAEVEALLSQVTAGMPGFDLDARVTYPGRRHPAVWGLPAALFLAAATIIGLPLLPANLARFVPAYATPLLLALAGAAAVTGLAALTGRLPSPETKLRARLSACDFPAPASRRRRPRPPQKERTLKGTRTINGEKVPFEKNIPASDGDYPFHPATFLAGPSVFVGMVSPHAGAVSGAAATNARATPPVMLQPIGPLLGHNDDGSAHLSAAAMRYGVAVVGKPGTGKSLCVRSLFGWHCLERVRPSGRPGHPGRNNTLIAFESKGDGVARYVDWAHTLGDQVLVIDVADPSTPAIDVFAVPGDNTVKANFFTNALKYTFGDQAIGDRSFETLVAVFTAALAIDDDLLATLPDRDERLIPSGRSPIFYAYLLLGGYSDTIGVTLAAAIKDLATVRRERGTPDPDLEAGYAALASLYEGRTESARRSFLEAPRNKVAALLSLDAWWTPARRKVTWQQVLEGHRSIVQTDVATASEVASNVGSGGEWATGDIQHLAPFHVVVRSEVDQRRQSAFIVHLPNFEADIADYPAALVPSANPNEDLATHHRLDPYWDGLWTPGAGSGWSTASLSRREKKEGRIHLNNRLLIEKDEAIGVLTAYDPAVK